MILCILKWLMALHTFSGFLVDSTEYFDNYVHLPECSIDITKDTDLSTTTPRITCTKPTPKIQLGNTVDILIHSLKVDSNIASIANTVICQKAASDKTNVHIQSNVQQILFSVKNEPYVIVVGTTAGTCPNDIDVPLTTLESGYVEVNTVKCIEKQYLTKYEQNEKAAKKPFVEMKGKLCFFNPSLTTPIHVDERVNGKDYRFTISAYPKPECPQCKCEDASSIRKAKQ